MKPGNSLTKYCVTALLVTLAAIALGQSSQAGQSAIESPQKNQTVENLRMAFMAERNASALFTAYAKKADDEGYGQLASMFRAIAQGEGIHAANCATILESLGETPAEMNDPLIVLSTLENLNAADATQLYEGDTMYPEFIVQARKDNNAEAAQVFSQNSASEPMHHALFQQAIKDIDGFRGENVEFVVCSGCGFVARALNKSECPVCSAPKTQFKQVK